MQERGEPVADIGHLHLKVSDLERAIGFYRDVIGMTLQNRIEGAAFLGFRDYHHHLALNLNGLELTWDRPRERQPNPRPKDDQPLALEELLSELG
jgi:catechol-2,3-dioxygenase